MLLYLYTHIGSLNVNTTEYGISIFYCLFYKGNIKIFHRWTSEIHLFGLILMANMHYVSGLNGWSSLTNEI